MKHLFKKNAYSMAELLIAITLVAIIIIAASNINFNYSTDNARVESFKNKITSEIETVRTNDLVWKWIWTNLIVPESWEIDFSSNWSWSVSTYYYNPNKTLYNDMIIENNFVINNIICEDLNSWTTEANTASIYFEKWKYSLSGSCTPSSWSYYSKIKIEIWYKTATWEIVFDTVNWLIKR